MKKLILLSMSLLVFAACEKDDDKDENPTPSGQGNVVAEAEGKWLHGTFAMASYWGYDGSYQGNPFSQSIAFNFKHDGSYEMFYTGQSNNYGCTMDAFSYFKGYVTFTDTSFTVHPEEGRFRGYYACSSGTDFDRPAAASELKVETYYYHFETDANSKKWMVIGFTPNDQYPSFFGATSW